MNYYEELGVSQEASGEEIRKAHRRLVKLMHPDAQLDQGLKGLAETQMRRLNSIVSTLLDADQRRAYDDQLQIESLPSGAHSNSGRPSWRGVPWWLASASGAVVLTLFAVWLWADHLSSGFGKTNRTIYVRPVENPPAASEVKSTSPISPPDPAPSEQIGDSGSVANGKVPPLASDSRPEISQDKGSSSIPIVDPPAPKPTQQTNVNPRTVTPPAPVPVSHPAPASRPVISSPAAPLNTHTAKRSNPPPPEKSKPAVANIEKPKKPFSLPSTALIAQAHTGNLRSSGQLPAPPGLVSNSAQHDDNSLASAGTPLPMALAPKPEPVNVPGTISKSGASARPRDPLEGEWIYAPKEPERRKPGFYPPEFIDLKLVADGDPGNLHGQYNARYVITDKPISPEVSFQLASVDKDARKFTWQSPNGARGTVAIHPVDDNTIRIEWRTTTSVRGPALTSGAATLVRRQ